MELDLHIVLDQSQYVQQRLNGVVGNLILGSVLVIAISLLILGWKSALLVGLALPLTTLTVFGTMKAIGVPLHQMSVTGIIIALGLLIDNAIIVVDEVQGRLRQGLAPGDAVSQTVGHLLVPLVASTLTTVLAFVPIATSPGGTGEFIGTIGLTVILALLSSLALSLTVIVSLVGRLHQWNPLPQRWNWLQTGLSNEALAQSYRWTLGMAFRRPWLGVGLSLVLPVVGFAVFATLPQQFFPPTNRDQFQIEFELPAQTALDTTQAQVHGRLGNWLSSIPKSTMCTGLWAVPCAALFLQRARQSPQRPELRPGHCATGQHRSHSRDDPNPAGRNGCRFSGRPGVGETAGAGATLRCPHRAAGLRVRYERAQGLGRSPAGRTGPGTRRDSHPRQPDRSPAQAGPSRGRSPGPPSGP
jgi:hypothetical protein